MAASILVHEFFLKDTEAVARNLLGKILCLRRGAGRSVERYRIVETEAYLGLSDPACHSYHGKPTARVASMYLSGGHVYVYLIYGMYSCLNIVTGDETKPEAVLIRAVEPLADLGTAPAKKLMTTNGPGKLCRQLGIDRVHFDGLCLWKKDSALWIEEGEVLTALKIRASARIGVQNYGGDAGTRPLRFHILDNPYVSRK